VRRKEAFVVGGKRLGVSVVLLVSAACGSPAPERGQDLFLEYARSTHVKGDDQYRGATSADRLAEFAAEGSRDTVESRLLAAYPCDAGCLADGNVEVAARDFGGPAGTAYQRKIVVKRRSGRLELMTLYVVRRPDGARALIDPDGRRYTGGLGDFRRHNRVLGGGDLILTLRNVTATPGEGRIITVSGHTSTRWWPWLTGGIGLLVIAGAATILVRRRAIRRDWGDAV
jgi:hypothetical protein